MTPITREQAAELAEKHGWQPMGGDYEFAFDAEEVQAMLTDFAEQVRQQVIAEQAAAIASLQAKLEQSEARARDLEKEAARYRFLRDVPYTPELQQAMTQQANGKFDELIDAALNKEPGHEA